MRELRVVPGRDAGAFKPGYQSGTSPCVQLRTENNRTKEKYTVDKMLGTDRSMKLVLCDCGGLRLISGSVTIHFSREEFQAFAAAVGRLASIVALPTIDKALKATRTSVSEVCH